LANTEDVRGPGPQIARIFPLQAIPMPTHESITVYYDSECPVCSREVDVYRKLDRPGRIRWHDLGNHAGDLPDLDAAYELLHVRDARGVLQVGFAAHLLMWQHLPAFRLLAWTLRRCRPSAYIAERIYLWLTARRPGLMRRRRMAGGADA